MQDTVGFRGNLDHKVCTVIIMTTSLNLIDLGSQAETHRCPWSAAQGEVYSRYARTEHGLNDNALGTSSSHACPVFGMVPNLR